jgi:hypothetical protein
MHEICVTLTQSAKKERIEMNVRPFCTNWNWGLQFPALFHVAVAMSRMLVA